MKQNNSITELHKLSKELQSWVMELHDWIMEFRVLTSSSVITGVCLFDTP